MKSELGPSDFTNINRPSDLWNNYLHLAKKRTLVKNETLIHIGEFVDYLYIVESGMLRVTNSHLGGVEKIILYINKGNLCGETSFFLNIRSCTEIVSTEKTVVHAFSRACIMEKIFPPNSQIMIDICKNLAYKVRVLTEQIMVLSQDNAMVKVGRYLYLTLENTPAGLIARPKLSQNDLANFLGLHRTTLYKILRELEARQIISAYKKEHVGILDERAFRSLLHA